MHFTSKEANTHYRSCRAGQSPTLWMPSRGIIRCGLPVEAAKEAVKCKDEIYLVIPDLQSAIEFQKGSHRL